MMFRKSFLQFFINRFLIYEPQLKILQLQKSRELKLRNKGIMKEKGQERMATII